MVYDVVYILKNGKSTEELKYSLRSLKNFPHGKVWIFGGEADGIKPDAQVSLQQMGRNKWEKVRNTLFRVCDTTELTDDFWLFNDDFFCMKPCEYMPPYYNGDLQNRISSLEKAWHGMTKYSRQLRDTQKVLKIDGLGTLNYAVHMPMLVNKGKAFEVLAEYREVPMFRSLYGNYWSIGGINRDDVKITKPDVYPDPDTDWLSTSDGSFRYGKVGEYIRSQFPEASEYER